MLNKLKRSIKIYLVKFLRYSSSPEYGLVSYAQEGEDILLWRMIFTTLEGPGTFVEVGCNHPWNYSNTAFWYERGWRGVAIDPNPEFGPEFGRSRPGDIFINMGVSDQPGELIYHKFSISLYNTFSVKNAEVLVRNSVVPPPLTMKVRVETLSTILANVWPEGKKIDLLSVDAEGLDFQILKGHDFLRYPVKYLIIEPDACTLTDLTQAPVIEYLTNLGFTPVSKLCKSVILIANSELKKWKE